MMKSTSNVIDIKELYAPLFSSAEGEQFAVKDKATTIDVTTHFTMDGRQSVLQQFKELIISERLLG